MGTKKSHKYTHTKKSNRHKQTKKNPKSYCPCDAGWGAPRSSTISGKAASGSHQEESTVGSSSSSGSSETWYTGPLARVSLRA